MPLRGIAHVSRAREGSESDSKVWLLTSSGLVELLGGARGMAVGGGGFTTWHVASIGEILLPAVA